MSINKDKQHIKETRRKQDGNKQTSKQASPARQQAQPAAASSQGKTKTPSNCKQPGPGKNRTRARQGQATRIRQCSKTRAARTRTRTRTRSRSKDRSKDRTRARPADPFIYPSINLFIELLIDQANKSKQAARSKHKQTRKRKTKKACCSLNPAINKITTTIIHINK